jgi:hypothetical protein
MGIRIEGGCWIADHDLFGTPLWQYPWNDSDGFHVETFTTGGLIPVIGDTIENGVLVPKSGYIINNDPGFQKKHTFKPRAWPIEGQDS